MKLQERNVDLPGFTAQKRFFIDSKEESDIIQMKISFAVSS
jgi:hypothetical protein